MRNRTRTIQHEGAELELDIEHDRQANKLFVTIDGVKHVIESTNSSQQPPATCRTTGEVLDDAE